MTQQVFAQFIEMSPASLSSIFNGRTKPTLNIVEAIKTKIPNINTDWLMFGSGSMFVEDKPTHQGSPLDNQDHENSPIDFGNNTPTPQSKNHQPIANDLFAAENVRPTTPNINSVKNTHPEIVREEIKYIDKPQRKITEIRVYFDDLTYETFVPAKK